MGAAYIVILAWLAALSVSKETKASADSRDSRELFKIRPEQGDNLQQQFQQAEDNLRLRISHMESSRAGGRADPGILLELQFPSGKADKAVLSSRSELSGLSSCVYSGQLRKDPSAWVTITGCPELGQADREMTLVSKDHSGQYSINQMGEVRALPWVNPGSHSASPLSKPGNEPHVFNVHSRAAGQDGKKWTLVEEDQYMNEHQEFLAAQINTICQGSQDCGIPPAHQLTLRIGYDQSLRNRLALEQVVSPEAWIEQVMAHTQTLFLHPSLPSKLYFKLLFFGNEFWRADSSIASVRDKTEKIIKAENDTSTNLFVYLCADGQAYYGTVGIAYLGSICNTEGYAVSLTEWRNTTTESGKIVAHEIGHNLGMCHDFTEKNDGNNCTGIMDYGETPDLWSNCSRRDFINDYNAKVLFSTQKPHCMRSLSEEEVNDLTSTSSPPDEEVADPSKCPYPQWMGDGYCDDETNNAVCAWDYGDCCKRNTSFWNVFCIECICYQGFQYP